MVYIVASAYRSPTQASTQPVVCFCSARKQLLQNLTSGCRSLIEDAVVHKVQSHSGRQKTATQKQSTKRNVLLCSLISSLFSTVVHGPISLLTCCWSGRTSLVIILGDRPSSGRSLCGLELLPLPEHDLDSKAAHHRLCVAQQQLTDSMPGPGTSVAIGFRQHSAPPCQ